MIQLVILKATIQLIIPVVLIFLFLKDRNKENYIRILIFILVSIISKLVQHFPIPVFNSDLNWNGKICALIFSVICYFGLRKYFSENNFFTLKQDVNQIKLPG